MSRRLIEDGLGWRWRAPAIAREIRDEDACVLVARTGSRIAGFAVMHFDFERQRAHLLLLAVAPGARRRGLGGALLSWLETVARRGGIREIVLEVRAGRAGARRFYRAGGYCEVSRVSGYYQGCEDAVRMRRSF